MSKRLRESISDILGREIEMQPMLPFTPNSLVIGVRRLPSKKNVVYHIATESGGIVLKVHGAGRAGWEYDVLVRCVDSGVHVPRPFLHGPDFILMEYLKGPNLCDALNRTLDMAYPILIADWFAGFHLSFNEGGRTLVKSDAKLQNLILTQNGLAGLDFELAHKGDFLEDLGELCAHILNTDPMLVTPKYQMCDALLTRYRERTGWELAGMTRWLLVALEEAARFRPHQSQILTDLCNELEGGNVWPFCLHDPQNR